MRIWALADLHLAIGDPSKDMAFFGPVWDHYMDRIAKNWRAAVQSDDLVLIAGDISWALRLEDAVRDLEWIDALPGTKLVIKGNHDLWWTSQAKMAKVCPPSIHLMQNSVFNWRGFSIGGARLWDTPEYRFSEYIQFQENKKAALAPPSSLQEDEKIFLRELERLKLSLKQLNPQASKRIVMTHYPPISADLKPSRACQILEEFKVDICVFGHLHNVKKEASFFGEARGVKYLLTAADYLDFKPLRVL